MLRHVSAWAERITRTSPWTNVYGTARTILASAVALTLLFNDTETLFRPAVGRPDLVECVGLSRISIFCILEDDLEVARFISIALLVLVASGWRPRLTGPIQWWTTYGLAFTMTIPDGGDHLASILSLMLVPWTLTDSRVWHWQTPLPVSPTPVGRTVALIAFTTWIAIRLQMAGVYLHAAVAKLGVEEWADGTALYYWLSDPVFGLPGWLRPVVGPLLTLPLFAALFTWGPIIVEFALFLGLFLDRRWWGPLLVAGIALHAGIAVLMGLPTFSMTSIAGLIIYLRPLDRPFVFPHLHATRSRSQMGSTRRS